jgi:hypothetical protein
MKLFLLATVFAELINSANWAKNFCRRYQSKEHRVLDSEVERVQNSADYYQRETDQQLKEMVVTLTKCQHYQGEFGILVGDDEFSKYQSEHHYNCEDPSEIIEKIQKNNEVNLVRPKKFTERMFLSNEQMKQEYIDGVKLKDGKMSEFWLARQKEGELEGSAWAYSNQVEMRTFRN